MKTEKFTINNFKKDYIRQCEHKCESTVEIRRCDFGGWANVYL